MRTVPVAAALLVILGGISFAARGNSRETRTDSAPHNYLTKSSDGKSGQELALPGPRVGKTSDSPFLVSQEVGSPPDGRRRPKPHRVTLSWEPSQSGVESGDTVGYNVFRCGGASARCVRINTDLVIGPSYVDYQVRAGSTYFYATTAVNQAGRQSRRSNIVKVVIPFP
jgi:hypothetical protein